MAINYEDDRFKKVETEKDAALTQMEQTYQGIADSAEKVYTEQMEANKQWGEQQQQIQKEQAALQQQQMEQQKLQAEKDYQKEQSAAYADWKKQSNRYGVAAEQIADAGLSKTGYSETSQVAMYISYQERVASAREAYTKAVADYDIAMQQAQAQNNAAMAEIAYNTLQQQIALSVQMMEFANQLELEKHSQRQNIDATYYARSQDALSQILYEMESMGSGGGSGSGSGGGSGSGRGSGSGGGSGYGTLPADEGGETNAGTNEKTSVGAAFETGKSGYNDWLAGTSSPTAVQNILTGNYNKPGNSPASVPTRVQQFESKLLPESKVRTMYGSMQEYIEMEVEAALKKGTITEADAVEIFTKYRVF